MALYTLQGSQGRGRNLPGDAVGDVEHLPGGQPGADGGGVVHSDAPPGPRLPGGCRPAKEKKCQEQRCIVIIGK
jgi:hypothetical protein